MTEYIDRGDLIKFLDSLQQPKFPITNGFKFISIIDAIKVVSERPTADVKPIVHAHWDVIDQDSEGDEVYVHTWETLCCSLCGIERTTEDGYIPQYCESCGAKMDE